MAALHFSEFLQNQNICINRKGNCVCNSAPFNLKTKQSAKINHYYCIYLNLSRIYHYYYYFSNRSNYNVITTQIPLQHYLYKKYFNYSSGLLSYRHSIDVHCEI